MKKCRVVIPLPYKSVTTFEGPIWYFDAGVYLDTISDDDFGAFLRDVEAEHYRAVIAKDTICIYLTELTTKDTEAAVKQIAGELKFVLNVFSAGTPVVLPFAVILDAGTLTSSTSVKQIFDIEAVVNPHVIKSQTYRIKPTSEPETISKLYRVVHQCCSTSPEILFSLERFNSCLTRPDIQDRIVDVTIALESLIGSRDELRFKFSLYNSHTAEDEPTRRVDAFNLFQRLYDVRSAIVHGDIKSRERKKNLQEVERDWTQVVRLATASLSYFLLYRYGHPKREDWDQHLKDLVFGRTRRIVN